MCVFKDIYSRTLWAIQCTAAQSDHIFSFKYFFSLKSVWVNSFKLEIGAVQNVRLLATPNSSNGHAYVVYIFIFGFSYQVQKYTLSCIQYSKCHVQYQRLSCVCLDRKPWEKSPIPFVWIRFALTKCVRLCLSFFLFLHIVNNLDLFTLKSGRKKKKRIASLIKLIFSVSLFCQFKTI